MFFSLGKSVVLFSMADQCNKNINSRTRLAGGKNVIDFRVFLWDYSNLNIFIDKYNRYI